MINILGFAGSLRQQSYNRALLKNCLELLPPDSALEIFDLEGIPLFNQDLEASLPPVVAEFKRKIETADALLIVTPEYNYSVPGVLKNAIDWASRPSGGNSFKGKNAAIMSASTGMLGGARAQYHLRQSLVYLDVYPLNKPEIFVTFAAQKFDAQGRLTDEQARELIRLLLKTLVEKARVSPGKT
jgi:chromate reductase, NAD(P)H dehydrogenase (quinone)